MTNGAYPALCARCGHPDRSSSGSDEHSAWSLQHMCDPYEVGKYQQLNGVRRDPDGTVTVGNLRITPGQRETLRLAAGSPRGTRVTDSQDAPNSGSALGGIPLHNPAFGDLGPAVTHDYACPVCSAEKAVYDMNAGLFQPCWSCQRKGWVLKRRFFGRG